MKIKNSKKGFTIIELIVVMAVFLFIIGAAIGIFISIVQNQKRILAQQQLLNQISYVEEYMSKALRMAVAAENDNCIPTGYIYQLTRYNGAGGFYQGIKFINPSDNDACQEFFLAGTGSANDPYILKELKDNTNDGKAVNLVSTNLQFNQENPIRFSVNGSNGSQVGLSCDALNRCGAIASKSSSLQPQPRVTVLLNVKIAGDSQTKAIQTTVSQRNLNVVK